MSELENRTFTPNDVEKLRETVRQGVIVLRELEDLKGGLNDTVKAVAETLGVKPSLINKAIRTEYKSDLEEKRDEFSDLEEVLELIKK